MKELLVLIVAVMVGGCASNPNRYQNTPSAKLCIDYLSIDDRTTLGVAVVSAMTGTTVRNEMELELKRRSEDCSNPAYLSAAQAKVAAERPIEVNVRQKP